MHPETTVAFAILLAVANQILILTEDTSKSQFPNMHFTAASDIIKYPERFNDRMAHLYCINISERSVKS